MSEDERKTILMAIRSLRSKLLPDGLMAYSVAVTTSNAEQWLRELEDTIPLATEETTG